MPESSFGALAEVLRVLRCDNGTGFTLAATKMWLSRIGVELLYIEPGSPWQIGLCESFSSRLRYEYLQQTNIVSEADGRGKARVWRDGLNEEEGRPGAEEALEYFGNHVSELRVASSVGG